MEAIKKFYTLMCDYDAVLERMLKLESSKIRIIASGTSAGLDNCMREEEAEMLRMRGLDVKREELLKTMHMEGKTIEEIIATPAAAQIPELQPLCMRMKERTRLLKERTKSTSNMLRSRLSVINKVISGNSGAAESYGKDGQQLAGRPLSRMKPRRI